MAPLLRRSAVLCLLSALWIYSKKRRKEERKEEVTALLVKIAREPNRKVKRVWVLNASAFRRKGPGGWRTCTAACDVPGARGAAASRPPGSGTQRLLPYHTALCGDRSPCPARDKIPSTNTSCSVPPAASCAARLSGQPPRAICEPFGGGGSWRAFALNAVS